MLRIFIEIQKYPTTKKVKKTIGRQGHLRSFETVLHMYKMLNRDMEDIKNNQIEF